MRVRKRYAVMLAIAAVIGGVAIFQALTARPPEPYVRLVGDGRPLAPVARYICSQDGWEAMVYTTSDGVQLDPQPTGRRCSTPD